MKLTVTHEPSWTWANVGSALCDHALRPRCRLPLTMQHETILHQWLLYLGRAANENSEHVMAHAYFESAYNCKDDISALLSATNMRLKLGQLSLVQAMYKRLLTEPQWLLKAQQREMITRKLAEATEAAAARSRATGRPLRLLEDEIAQLLRDRRSLVPQEEADLFVRLTRRQGHVANDAGDFEAARLWFDCAYGVSQSATDLLSAANMRTKLVEGSAAAEALYIHILALPTGAVGENELHIAMRKLDALRDVRSMAAEASENLPPARFDIEAEDVTGEDDWASTTSWLATTMLRQSEGNRDDGEDQDAARGDGGEVLLMADQDQPCHGGPSDSLSHHWWAARDEEVENDATPN